MALPREYVAHFANALAKRLDRSGKVKINDKAWVGEQVQQVLKDDFAREERLNDEVRAYLEKYNEQIRRDAISYQEMYKLVKKELVKKYRITSSSRPDPDGSKIGRDKVIELSHQMVKSLSGASQIELLVEKNEVRLEIMRQMQALLREENQMDQSVRQKIRSQKRDIAEGSAEWDILFKKYYSEELRKLGAA
jgi:hypothetical protein